MLHRWNNERKKEKEKKNWHSVKNFMLQCYQTLPFQYTCYLLLSSCRHHALVEHT
jgi:hypothetical protein